MPQVYIPLPMRPLTDGKEIVEASGNSIRQLIDSLESTYPGIKDRLVHDDQLQPGIMVTIGTAVSSLGLLQPVSDDDEVHFLPAIGGG